MILEDKKLDSMILEIKDKAFAFGIKNLENDYILNSKTIENITFNFDNIDSIIDIFDWLNRCEEDASLSKKQGV